MLTVPKEFATLYDHRSPPCSPSGCGTMSKSYWSGPFWPPANGPVTAALRVMGLAQAKVLSTVSSRLEPCRLVQPGRLAPACCCCWCTPSPPLDHWCMGLDDTLERRRGAKIRAKGIYRDPVRSSHSHLVKASGLRWLSLMLLVPIPWARRVWALALLDGPGALRALTIRNAASGTRS